MLLRTVERFRLVVGSRNVVSRFTANSPVVGLGASGAELDDDWSLAKFLGEKRLFLLEA